MTTLWDLDDGKYLFNISSQDSIINVNAGQCGLDLIGSTKDNA